MMEAIAMFDAARQMALLGDWTDRVAKGELPKSDPPRPQGTRAQHRRHGMGLGHAEILRP